MQRAELEDLVRLAIEQGLIGADKRRALLHGLPMGFIYSLPTVSRPIDQLRFDLMELQRTPRLIGLDRPPLAVWLENAAESCATKGAAEAARSFAEAAEALGSSGLVARMEQRFAPPAAVATAAAVSSVPPPDDTTPAQSAAAPSGPMHVFALAPAVQHDWKAARPTIELAGQSVAAVPPGRWAHEEPPYGQRWTAAREALRATLRALPPDGSLAVLPHGPVALAAWVGKWLGHRAHYTIFESTRESGQAALRPFGPTWASAVTPADDVVSVSDDPLGDTTDVVFAVQLDRRLDNRALEQALEARGVGEAPRLIVSVERPGRTAYSSPAQIEGIVDAIDDTLRRVGDTRSVQRLHLIHHGPSAVLMRVVEALPAVETIVYEHQSAGRYVPAVYLGGPRDGELVRPARPEQPGSGDGYDVFIACTEADRPFATALYHALGAAGKSAFIEHLSLVAGDVGDIKTPAAQARSAVTCVIVSGEDEKRWDLMTAVEHAIRRIEGSPGTHRIVPILLDGIDARTVPHGLGRVKGIEVGDQTIEQVVAQIVRALDATA